MTTSRVRQLRVVVTADDFDQALSFYRDVLGEPAVTPWDSVNSRLRAPAGVQLTLFEELGGT
jgi:catechol 2,3-dioxygenase-like lactoylglutathione lyase family enzyme